MCCKGKSNFFKHFPKDIYDEDLDYCCGDGIYDPVRTICCAGKLYALNGDTQRCCGEILYNPTNQICCRDKVYDILYSLSHIKDCCGDVPFDPYVHVCCGGSLYYKGRTNIKYSCCGTKPYEEGIYSCCQGVLYNTITEYRCCGKDYFNSSDITLKCCFDQVYNNITEICCNDKVTTRLIT